MSPKSCNSRQLGGNTHFPSGTIFETSNVIGEVKARGEVLANEFQHYLVNFLDAQTPFLSRTLSCVQNLTRLAKEKKTATFPRPCPLEQDTSLPNTGSSTLSHARTRQPLYPQSCSSVMQPFDACECCFLSSRAVFCRHVLFSVVTCCFLSSRAVFCLHVLFLLAHAVLCRRVLFSVVACCFLS